MMANFMTEKQQEAHELILSGHNVFLSGQAGSGKSWLLNRVCLDLMKYKVVAVTATTGIATKQFQKNIHATTIHHWAGLFDGRYTTDRLRHQVLNREDYSQVKSRIEKTDVLIIDEISMFICKQFDQLEEITRFVRNSNLPFGGIQVIGCGSFRQLPPIANYLHNDSGDYCFISDRFNLAFPHKIVFEDVLRQEDIQLINCINELESGNVSKETCEFLKGLDRPIHVPECDVVHLFAQKLDVQMYNEMRLSELQGPEEIFRSSDKKYVNISKSSIEKNINAPRCVRLKSGAPVLLTYNIDIKRGLVNGLRGTVCGFPDNRSVMVNFGSELSEVEIKPVDFTIYDPKANRISYKRQQIPLILGYSMTIHKSQGMSIEYLEVDCEGIFAPGQLAVAVGRAQTTNGFRLRNFHQHHIIPHAASVDAFYTSITNELPDINLECCQTQNQVEVREVQQKLVHIPVHVIPIDINEEVNDIAQDLEQEDIPNAILPIDKDIFSFNVNSDTLTDLQKEMVEEFSKVSSSPRLVVLWNFIIDFARGKLKQNPTTKDWTLYCSELLHFFNSSPEYQDKKKKLFQCSNITNAQHKVVFKLAFKALRGFFESKVSDILGEEFPLTVAEDPSQSTTTDFDDLTKSKIRYIGGSCVVALRKRLTKNFSAASRNLKQQCLMWKLLRVLQIERNALLQSTSYESSLEEIERKQDATFGLTHITDDAFEFFMLLASKASSLDNEQNIHKHGSKLFRMVLDILEQDKVLLDKWVSLFSGLSVGENDAEDNFFSTVILSFDEIINNYVKIVHSNLRKEFRERACIKKTKALRTSILMASTSSAREAKKRKFTSANQGQSDSSDVEGNKSYPCPICRDECSDNPQNMGDQSIECVKCKHWLHYKCSGITGNERFLKSVYAKWMCHICKAKQTQVKGSKKGKNKQK